MFVGLWVCEYGRQRSTLGVVLGLLLISVINTVSKLESKVYFILEIGAILHP